MTIAIEDQQLDNELQELYLISKQWLSDNDFMASERLFLRKLVVDMPDATQLVFRPLIEDAITTGEKLKPEIMAFMQKLESFITAKGTQLDQTLIEDFVNLQQSVAGALKELKLLKYRVLETKNAA